MWAWSPSPGMGKSSGKCVQGAGSTGYPSAQRGEGPKAGMREAEARPGTPASPQRRIFSSCPVVKHCFHQTSLSFSHIEICNHNHSRGTDQSVPTVPLPPPRRVLPKDHYSASTASFCIFCKCHTNGTMHSVTL